MEEAEPLCQQLAEQERQSVLEAKLQLHSQRQEQWRVSVKGQWELQARLEQ